MKLGTMDLNKVPLAMTGVQDTGANDQMAQLGMRMFERFADYATRDEGASKGSGNGNGLTMRDMLEFWKLMQEMQGDRENPRARDNGFSDMAKVMQTMMEQNFAILREVTAKRSEERTEEDPFVTEIKKYGFQALMSKGPDPEAQLKDHLAQLVELQSVLQKVTPQHPAGPSIQEQLALKKFDAELEKMKTDTQIQLRKLSMDEKLALNESESQADLYKGAFGALGDFLKTRKEQAGLGDEVPTGRTAAPADAPKMTFNRFQCEACGADTIINAGTTVAFCPACGAGTVPERPSDQGEDNPPEEAE